LRVAARAGRTWVGLDTPHHPYPAPVFRIAEKLGMRLEGTFAYDWYGGLAKRFPQPRPQRMAGIFDHYRMLGEPAVFLSDPGWYWARLLPGRKAWIDQFGFRLAGTPVHLVRHRHIVQDRQRYVVRTANLYDRPTDFPAFLTGLLGYAVGRRHGLVIRYPAAWKDDLRRAARGLVPNLCPGRTCRLSVSRLYGRRLTP
jgi:hypothetical protein